MNKEDILSKEITHDFSIEEMKFLVSMYIADKKKVNVNMFVNEGFPLDIVLLNQAFTHAYYYYKK